MGYAFTEEQEVFRRSVERCLEREMDFAARRKLIEAGTAHAAPVWSAFAEMGLLALPIPERRGGLGGSMSDVAAVSEVMGRRMSIEPFLSTVMLGGVALALAPATSARDAILEAMVAGSAHLALAHEEDHGSPDPARVALRASRTSAGWRLEGVKKTVLGADLAGHLVVSARAEGAPGDPEGVVLLLVPADAPGMELRPFRIADGRTAAHVRFDAEVPDDALLASGAEGLPILREVIARGTVALCAEAVGAMGALMEATAAYANSRKQFGTAIGSFQALRHRIADMHMAERRARATLLVTAAMMDAGEAGVREISVLKAQTGRLGRSLGESAVQVHGAIGTTDELDVGHHLKRLMTAELLFGASRQHQRVIGALAGRMGNAAA